MEKDSSSTYIPGTCNIGPTEIRRRYRIGYFGLGLTIVIIAIVFLLDLPRTYRLLIFPSLFYSLSGFLQARQKFCFLFGMVGVFNIKGKRSQVKDELQRKKDRMKALWLITQIVVGSVAVTLLYYFLSPP